tara:strand:+ start:2512 stop:3381 length:870 start_codon:yes stop_codon:yes gene_type:complete
MKVNKGIIFGLVGGVVIISVSFVFLLVPDFENINLFYFLFGGGVLVGLLPFVISSIIHNRLMREKDEMFLEFARSLVESVESGTPISKSILNLRKEHFGALGGHVEKLANQIRLGIPLQTALETFAKETKSTTIIRAITLIREADKTGGNIESILSSVAKSVSEIEKLKAERRAAIASIVMEGYIIFLIFIIIMVVVEVQILPIAGTFEGGKGLDFSNPTDTFSLEGEEEGVGISDFSIAFLSLLITQGLFAGFVIGKLSEGNMKAGIKHSFILVAMAVLISTGSKLFM